MILQDIKTLFLTIFHRLDSIEIALFLGLFILFVFVFTLGLILYSKRFLPSILFLLSFVILFSSPFLIQYLMQQKIYKIQVDYQRASPLHYADAFLIDVDIKNLGKKNISKCIAKVDVLRIPSNRIERLKNIFYPEKSFTYLTNEHIPINQTHHFLIMIDNFYYRDNPYRVSMDCF